MYLCTRVIAIVSFYTILIIDFGIIPTVWYFRIIPTVWYFFVFLDFGNIPTVWYVLFFILFSLNIFY